MTHSKSKIILAWLGLVAVLGFAYWGMVADDLQQIAETEYNYKRKLALLQRLEALPSEEAAIRRQLEELSAEATSRFLYEGSDIEVQLRIQNDLRQLASSEGINVASMRTLGAPRPQGRLAKSSVQLNLTISFEKLVGFLQRIESWEPLLRVSSMSVRVRRPSTDSSAAELAVVLDMTGYRRTSEGGPGR